MNTLELVFATNNRHKVEEMQAAIGDAFRLLTLQDAGIDIEIPEPYETMEENANTKSQTIYHRYKKNCFGEDSGLEVAALNGEPGVRSARYAGDQKSSAENIEKLLSKLHGIDDRRARFRTVISLVLDGETKLFEGTCDGIITQMPRGLKGFGYDPVFIPNAADRTFAEMTLEEKSAYSHRRKAADKLIDYLKSQLSR